MSRRTPSIPRGPSHRADRPAARSASSIVLDALESGHRAAFSGEAEPVSSTSAPPQARLVSIEVAAQLLGIGRTTVYDLVNRGELRSTKIGRRTLLAVEDIDAFVHRKLASA